MTTDHHLQAYDALHIFDYVCMVAGALASGVVAHIELDIEHNCVLALRRLAFDLTKEPR